MGIILCLLIAYLLLHDNPWTINYIFDAYLSQEGEGGGGGEGGGEMEHIYNHPKGGLVPPPKEGLWGVGGCWGFEFFFFLYSGLQC